MALNAYLTLVGQKSGKIKGSVIQRGREGSSQVIAASHAIVSPRDAATGAATGRRQHKPLLITKELDQASPVLRQVLTTNEVLTQVELLFHRPERTGVEKHYFTTKLTNAVIVSIEMQMPNNRHADTATLETFEDVAFVYEKIEWTWIETGIVVADEWFGSNT